MGMHWLVLAIISLSINAETVGYIICKSKGNVRTIRNDVDTQGVCHTSYSKDGRGKEQGMAKSRESCDKVLNNIRDNLIKSNWKCRDVDAASFSESQK